MNFRDAEALAISYIEQYLPKEQNWKFQWMTRSIRMNGQCCYNRFTNQNYIKLGSSFVSLNTEEVVEKTIIHEIAHALTIGHGHDNVWKRKCIELGGTGSRLNRISVKPETPYIGKCPNGHEHQYSRRPKTQHSCGKCSPKYDTRFLITLYINPKYEKVR